MKPLKYILAVLAALVVSGNPLEGWSNDPASTPIATAGTNAPVVTSTSLAPPPEDPPCPGGMVEIDGDYCTAASEPCLTWVDKHGKAIPEAIPADHDSGRCGEFVYPTKCVGPKVHKHYCIDRYEYPNIPGLKPRSWMSWRDAKDACEEEGKRLATSDEWTLACEGPEMRPLPTGDGYHRDRTSCNIDQEAPHGVHILGVASQDSPGGRALDALLKPSGSMVYCSSPYGVYDLIGNVDEWVLNPKGHPSDPKNPNDHGPFVSGLKGGHSLGVRNACRPSTTAHNESFEWWEVGARCAMDAK